MYILMPYVCPLGITPSIGVLPPHFFPNLLKKYGIYQWTFHEVALLVPFFWVELEFRVLVFMEEEIGEPEEKTPGAKTRSINKNSTHM